MERMDMKKFVFPVLGLMSLGLSGCGAVNNAINSVIPEIDNLVRLDDTTVDAVVGSGRAVISGNVSHSVTFDDRTLPEQARIRRLRLRQSIDQDIQVTVPSGKNLPASFTLSNIVLTVRVTETGSTRSAESSASYSGSVTFTRQAATAVYRSTGGFEVSNVTFDNSGFSTLREIITTAPSPNTAAARLSFDTDDTQLPSGSTLRFKFVQGKAKVEL
jgi:hypothetical protein